MKITYKTLNQLDQDQRVSLGAGALFRAMARIQAGAMSWFKVSHAYLGALVNRSRATVKRYLVELEAAGYVVKRGNAAVFNGLKVKAANSYRLCAPGEVEGARKNPTAMRWKDIYQRAIAQTALWLTNARSESDREYNQPMIPGFGSQTALEAMRADRLRRRQGG